MSAPAESQAAAPVLAEKGTADKAAVEVLQQLPTEKSEATVADVPGSTSNPAQDAPASKDNGAVPDKSTAAAAESASSGPVKTPFTAPLPISTAPPAKELTADQARKYDALLSIVSSWTTVPITSAPNAPAEPITEDERMWLTRDCLLRYLRAVKWNATEAPKRLLSSLTWRREYGLKSHTADYISPENETGKQIILGYDNAARPCLYLVPSKQNTARSDKQLHHLVFMLERVIDLMVPGQETLSLLINFGDRGSGVTLAQGRETLHILQNHYPERLGRALVTNVPWTVWGFFKLITPFIDPLTREKLKFNEDLRQHVPPAQLWNTSGGDVDFKYDHAIYWPAIVKLAAERREAQRQRWVNGGSHVGESEGYLRGGAEKSIRERQGTAVPVAANPASMEDAVEKAPAETVVPDISQLKVKD
ncbi:MAG: hypothetical protein M1832_004293 [Thelocarpon impressellum]|nr:MAG: hypothetical protein M1832_004293 [Thelocarpon impressellum]